MNHTELNREAADAGRDAGAAAAAANADRIHGDWYERALEAFIQYAKERPTSCFMTEEVRAHAELNGMPLPPDRRAWGFVARRAAVLGHTAHAGYARQKAANCHSSPKSLWRLAA